MGWFASMMWWTAFRASSADACDRDLEKGQPYAPRIEINQNNCTNCLSHHRRTRLEDAKNIGAIRTSRGGHVSRRARRSQQSTSGESRARGHLSFSEQQTQRSASKLEKGAAGAEEGRGRGRGNGDSRGVQGLGVRDGGRRRVVDFAPVDAEGLAGWLGGSGGDSCSAAIKHGAPAIA